ncbi:odorant receptor 13a-like [Vespula maculifrons]|uniref:Odorant receptor 13a-like n=1 Tax=Vespula maculifrons TaxID=7453 RepID=A0ABD2C2H0_VESMC
MESSHNEDIRDLARGKKIQSSIELRGSNTAHHDVTVPWDTTNDRSLFHMGVLLSNMEEDRKNAKSKEEAKRMTNIAKICRHVSLACIITIRFVGRTLILRSYFPYDIQPTPIYELTVFAQTVAAYCTSGTYTTVDTFVVTLIFHVCGQYENLKQRLRNLPSQRGNDFKAELSQIVKKHDSLNRFADTIEEQFNDMLLLQMLGCTIQLCVTCFLVILVRFQIKFNR